MKKSGFRIHKRTVKRRASTVSQGRCIHGLPCSLPVTSWTLILLLLLTSSFSHVHETGDRVAGDAAVGAHEEYFESSKSKEVILGGRVGTLLDRSSAQHTEDSNYDRPETRPDSDSFPALEASRPGVLDDTLGQTQGIHPSVASTLDALQYAEYGAVLLHKSVAAEEGLEACTVGNTRGTHCPVLIDPDGSAPSECVSSSGNLLCTTEFVSEEHHQIWNRARRIGKCSSFKLGVDPKTCHYYRSLRDVFLHSSAFQEKPVEQQRRSNDYKVDDDLNYEVNLETSINLSGQIEVRETADMLTSTTPSSDDSNSLKVNDIGFQEGVVIITSNRDEVPEEGGISHEDLVAPPSDFEIHEEVGNDRGKDTMLPRREVNTETSTDIDRLEESRLSGYPQVDIEVLQAGLDDVLTEELESMMKAEEGGLASFISDGVETNNGLEPVELRRVGLVMSLDEYKRSILEKQKLDNVVNFSTLQTHKTRHSDESYNYAASSHGAKALSANKEAKGAGHIINSDKDKYLRNPCSAEDKFVVLELSEETFVDTIVIANFEFHSANVKDFEVYGSPVYPSKEWILLGRFHAENVRNRQRFTIEDPKLVRYVMLKMLSHWGSEFFCTLSAVEVFGVDVIKNLLDDWIASEGENGAKAQLTGSIVHHEETSSDLQHSSAASSGGAVAESLGAQSSAEASSSPDSPGTTNQEKVDRRDEDSKAGDSVAEVLHMPGGKPPGDSVLKILMQKVKALELNQSLFDNYLEDTNTKYKAMLSELDKDLALLSERLRNQTAMSALLAIRLLDMESKLKEEKAYLEYQFSMVASNFTENVEFMRWQIQSMERREITAVILGLFSPVLSALLLLLARCTPNGRTLSTEEHTLQTEGGAEKISSQLDACGPHSVCKLSSSAILYLACGLIVLVLSV